MIHIFVEYTNECVQMLDARFWPMSVCVCSVYQIEHTYCAYMPIDERWTVFVPFFVFVPNGTCFTCDYSIHLLHTCSFFLTLGVSVWILTSYMQTHTLFNVQWIVHSASYSHTNARARVYSGRAEIIGSRLYNMSLCHLRLRVRVRVRVKEKWRCGQRQSEIYNARFWIFLLVWKVHTRIWLHMRQHFMNVLVCVSVESII